MRRLVAVAAVMAALGGVDESASQAKQFSGMSWLDNGQIRLGANLSLGGAITWLSEGKDAPNMINSSDWGRQIQMSFYSGPRPFVPKGATGRPMWKKLGWNPIQSGDCFGHRSRVTAHRNDGNTLYVRCVPKIWPLKNVPGECEFECWFRLEGPTVQARSRLTNHRSDRTQYSARTQELPAVYCNGPWYKLVSYLGDKPFTGAAPTVLVDRNKGGFPWRQFYSPECWAALLDKNDRGLGIYEPGACTFNGGFAGKKGSGGPKDFATSHMTPKHVEILDHNIVYTYEYTLIVGSLDEIRNYVYAHHDKDALPAWRFESDRQHWRYRNTTDAGWPIRGCLEVRMGPKRAALVGPETFWRAEAAPRLYIRAAFPTGAKSATVAFRPFDRVHASHFAMGKKTGRPKPAPAGRVSFDLRGDGRMHDVTVDLSKHKDYRGAMTQLMLILPRAKGTAKIHSIGFRSPQAGRPLE